MSATDLQPLSAPYQDGLPTRQRMAALIAISLAVAMANLDTAITNTALPTIATSIGADPSSVIWVVNAYQLAMIATLLPFASLGDCRAPAYLHLRAYPVYVEFACLRPRMVAAFTGCGARAARCRGSRHHERQHRAHPFLLSGQAAGPWRGLNALVVAVSFTIGPTVASAILSVASWHWLFLVNVPIGMISIAMASGTLPVTLRARHGFDMVAALLCATFSHSSYSVSVRVHVTA